jgi:hypothetical protein
VSSFLYRLGNVVYYLCVAGAWSVGGDVLLVLRSKSILEQARVVEDGYKARGIDAPQLCPGPWHDYKPDGSINFDNLIPKRSAQQIPEADCALFDQASMLKARERFVKDDLPGLSALAIGAALVSVLFGWTMRYLLSGRTDFR